MPIDLNQPVSLLTSSGGLLQSVISHEVVTQLRNDEWVTDITERELPSYSATVFEQSLGTGNGATLTFAVTLSHTPIVPESADIQTGAVLSGNDNGDGVITGSAPDFTGTINYATGAISITYSVAPANGVAIKALYEALDEGEFTYLINAVQLKNEIQDFVFGYSTPRVSPYNAAPYEGALESPVSREDVGVEVPTGYLEVPGYTTIYGPDSITARWLAVNPNGTDFMLYDGPKAVWLPYDYGLYGPPEESDELLIDNFGVAGGFVNPYFSPIGRATSDLFPPSLAGDPPIIQFTFLASVPSASPYSFNININLGYSTPLDYGGYQDDVGVTDYFGNPFLRVSTITGPNQYKVAITSNNGVYTFYSGDTGRSVYITFTYRKTLPLIFAGVVPPESDETPGIDETGDGVPPVVSSFLWTYTDTSPYTNSTNIADSMVESIPIVSSGTGTYLAGDIVGIVGGLATAKILSVSAGRPTSVRLWKNGPGYSNGTKATTGGGGQGLTLSITVVGASRDKPVSLGNVDGPDVWDLVNGGYVPSIVMQDISNGYASSGKMYIVPAEKRSTDPNIGPRSIQFPLSSVDVDNPTLMAELTAVSINPIPANIPGFGLANGPSTFAYNVEDNAWSLLKVGLSVPGQCAPIIGGIAGGQLYNFIEHSNITNTDLYASCYPAKYGYFLNGPPYPSDTRNVGVPGGYSTSSGSNICQSVSDLADAMLAAGASEEELPALVNVLAATIDSTFRIIVTESAPYAPTYLEYALMVQAILQGGVGNLLTMVPQAKLAIEQIFNDNLVRLLETSATQSLFSVAFDLSEIGGATAANGFSGSLNEGELINLGTTPPISVRLRKFSGTPSTANGFVNAAAGVIPIITSTNNPLGRCSYNIFSTFWAYALPLSTNVWWYYGNPPDYSKLPIPVYVYNATPTPAPGLPPIGKFGSCDVCSDTLDTRDTIPAHP